MSSPSPLSDDRKFHPRCRWRISEWALYWVATPMRRMPELIAFDSAKSMIRLFPAELDRRFGPLVGQAPASGSPVRRRARMPCCAG